MKNIGLKIQLWEILLWLGLGLIGLLIGLWARVIILDDALITFRIAENLAYGRGFVYNLGERVQVTTTPLYALSLVPGIWSFGSAPRAALILNLALAALIPLLAYEVGRRLAGPVTGLSGALLLSLAPLLVMAFSMESYLYVALILASLVAYLVDRWRLAGILVGVTALVRGDAALLGACLLTYDFLAYRRLRWRLIIPAIAIPAGWYLFATLYYGSPFPATLNAKTAQGEFNWLGQRFADGWWAYWREWTRIHHHDALYLFPILITIALIWSLWAERRWLILAGYSLLYIATFVTLAVPTAQWYYAPLMPAAALLTGRGVQFITHDLPQLLTRKNVDRLLPNSLAAILLFMLLLTLYPMTSSIIQQNPDWKAQVYPDTARWIAQNTNPSANLATIDIGHLGYWSGRHIIDIVGLAQPDVATHIAQGDFGYAIQHYQPDMVLIGYSWLPEVQTTAWFQETYIPRHYFKSKTLDIPLLLFSRRQGVKVQPVNLTKAEISPLRVDFNRQITLTGYHLNQPLSAGGPLRLVLLWQAEALIEVDFTVFVQLVDAHNQIKAQSDGRPQQGFYGTTSWQPGESIIDVHTFPIPGDLPPGTYDILLGLYEAETGLRLQILDEAGIFTSDHVRLSGIQVQAPF